MNRTQRDRYLDKMNRYHEAVAEALERAKRNNINKPYDIATLILTVYGKLQARHPGHHQTRQTCRVSLRDVRGRRLIED